MSILTALARPFLAAPFIASGVDAARNPEDHVEAGQRLNPILEKLGVGELSDSSLMTATRIIGGVRIGAGLGMALGKKPRLSALTLALTEIPVGLAKNPVFISDDSEASLSGLLTSVGLVGGALVAAGDRRGKPSLAWRLEHRKDHKRELGLLADKYEAEMDSVREKAKAKAARLKEKAKN
ncbi:MAG: DoxX family membrane protein [Flaviflexus sp.]|nr:DoxX family membrane protein [Flaviflexus sp.]